MKTEQKSEEMKKSQHDANRDPLSGAAGAHPVGAGVGAVTGGVIGGVGAGAAIGTVAGPVGTLAGAAAGAVIGGVAGGLAGKAVAEDIDPTVEHGYWRNNYSTRPYITQGASYDEYAPAYQYGWESQAQYNGRSYEESEPMLARDWTARRGKSNLQWEQAKHAVRDSWHRADHRKPKNKERNRSEVD